MSLIDILIGVAFGLSLGAIFGFLVSKYMIKPLTKATPPKQLEVKPSTIPPEEAKNARQELKTLLLEKDLLGNAITRVFELEAQGQVSKEERDILVKRYKDRLQEVDSKLDDIELIIEVGELEHLRNELVTLITRKLDDVDKKLEKALIRLDAQKIRSPPLTAQSKGQQAKEATVPKVEKRQQRILESSVDKELKQYREEIMEALDKLEQIDLEEGQ
ncbi:MAG: hypothetical protein ABSB40_10310 [Nitrososphaeria archaeon]|jgi:hypothetical protein